MLQEAKSREADSEGEEGEIERQPLLKAEAEEEEGGEAGKYAGELGREGHRLIGESEGEILSPSPPFPPRPPLTASRSPASTASPGFRGETGELTGGGGETTLRRQLFRP